MGIGGWVRRGLPRKDEPAGRKDGERGLYDQKREGLWCLKGRNPENTGESEAEEGLVHNQKRRLTSRRQGGEAHGYCPC